MVGDNHAHQRTAEREVVLLALIKQMMDHLYVACLAAPCSPPFPYWAKGQRETHGFTSKALEHTLQRINFALYVVVLSELRASLPHAVKQFSY